MGNQLAAVSETPVTAQRAGLPHETRSISCDPADTHPMRSLTPEQAIPAADELDDLGMLMVPASVAKNAAKLVDAEAAELFRNGLRGAAGKALLARDVAVSRAHVKLFQALLDAETQRVGRGRGNLKTARFFMDLLDRQHRHLVTTCELMLRLEIPSIPSVRVTADKAAFLLSAENGTNSV